MSSEPAAQFDYIYKIAYVFGSFLELNEPPPQFALLGNITTILGIMLIATARKRKRNASATTCQPTFIPPSEHSFNSLP